MAKGDLTKVYNQLLLASQDPVLFLAIKEEASLLSENDILIMKLCKALVNLMVYRLEDARKLALELYNNAIIRSDNQLTIMNLLTLSGICAKTADIPNMHIYQREAEQLLANEANSDLHLLLSCHKASAILRNADFMDAEEIAEQVKKGVENVVHPFVRADLLVWIGGFYNTQRKIDIALDYYSLAYDLCTSHKMNLFSMGICIETLSLWAQLKKIEMAERFYNQGLELIQQLRIPFFNVGLNFNYAMLRKHLEDFEASVFFYKKSLDALAESKVDLPQTTVNICNNLANVLNNMGKGEEALVYQLQAEQLLARTQDKEMEVNLSANIGLTMMNLGRWEEAIYRFKAAARYHRQHNNLVPLSRITRAMVLYYQERKDYLRGFAMHNRLDSINQELIASIQNENVKNSSLKLERILADSRALKEKYDLLLTELTKKQASRFVGTSKAAKRVTDSALLASMHPDANVFIKGESGTGKEVVAQIIHFSSNRKEMPFVTVSCSAITPSLIEGEFFGYASGSLTGSQTDKKGYFEQAEGGTLFLDEVSSLPVEFQIKMLQALDTKKIQPIGKDTPISFNCRIIASTNLNTLELIKEDRFKLQLFHRLNTLEIYIPPLRDRPEDIKPLVEYFAHEFSRETAKRFPTIKESFIERLNSYSFPGNARELRNIIERIYILYYAPTWNAEILDNFSIFKSLSFGAGDLLGQDIRDMERDLIIAALHKSNGKQKKAAALLNMTESTLCRKIQRYGIKKDGFFQA